MSLIVFIGKILATFENLKLRFINQYKLSCVAKHGVNCHIEGGGIYLAQISI